MLSKVTAKNVGDVFLRHAVDTHTITVQLTVCCLDLSYFIKRLLQI